LSSTSWRERGDITRRFAPVRRDLAEAERLLASQLDSAEPQLREVAEHLRAAGGKRLRPAMVLLSARAARPDIGIPLPRRVILGACAIEAVHMATLMHDDVVDDSRERRGRRTANSIWGNEISVLAGDFVLSKAMSVFADHTPPRAVRAVAHMTVSLCEGEMAQIAARGNVDNTVESYFRTIELKTANLFSTACRVGADLSGARRRFVTAASEFGRHYGTAFQIADDLLDLLGDPSVTGKPRGNDLKEGKFTLPVLLALRKLTGGGRRRFTDALRSVAKKGDAARAETVADIARAAIERGAVDESERLAQKAIERAVDSIGILASSPATRSLIAIARDAVKRVY
jgi:octaprenyl-diphosphate synthase